MLKKKCVIHAWTQNVMGSSPVTDTKQTNSYTDVHSKENFPV